ncbi:hypothetical protein [Streptacidiphilus sp. EB103A]|uniref:hypothetical protein n=1 Tax=Streptacidiphilus sp. EB103A TaxID=3156275 RepID=UPI003519BA1A
MNTALTPTSQQAVFAGIGRAMAEQWNLDRVLGGGWTSLPGTGLYGEATLLHPGGSNLWVRHEGSWRKGPAGRRMTVEGRLPSAFRGRAPQPFRPSLDRPVAAVARDVARRFLPGYLDLLERARADQALEDRAAAGRAELNRRMERVLPGLGPTAHSAPHEAAERKLSSWSGARRHAAMPPAAASGSVRLSESGASMELRLTDVPAELGLKILALLDPRTVLEGRVLAPEIAPAVRALEASPQILLGEVVACSMAGAQSAHVGDRGRLR